MPWKTWLLPPSPGSPHTALLLVHYNLSHRLPSFSKTGHFVFSYLQLLLPESFSFCLLTWLPPSHLSCQNSNVTILDRTPLTIFFWVVSYIPNIFYQNNWSSLWHLSHYQCLIYWLSTLLAYLLHEDRSHVCLIQCWIPVCSTVPILSTYLWRNEWTFDEPAFYVSIASGKHFLKISTGIKGLLESCWVKDSWNSFLLSIFYYSNFFIV